MMGMKEQNNKQMQYYKMPFIHEEQKKNNYRMIKEFYKIKKNMINYLDEGVNPSFTENFELLNYVNSGSSGVVYEGRSKKDPQKKVCLKFLLNESLDDRKDKSQNKKSDLQKIKEINIQNKLKDKNITEYYDYYNLKEYGCIIMEFAKYGDLDYFQKKLIQKTYLSETILAFITTQILNGLYYIHQSKVIHMDIKQQNILIDENLNVKITDFSVSLSYDQYKENDKIQLPLAGTSFYMSPEVLRKDKIDYEDCSKIDMFSLGVVLYNLAFGTFPYGMDYSDKKNFSTILKKIVNGPLIFPESKNYSFLFKKFLSCLLEKNIKNRLSIYEVFDDPWVKGAALLIKEKEKLYDLEKYILYLVTDNFKVFNDYLKYNSSDTFHTSN